MPTRPFLLIEDSYADVQAFMTTVKRIGLVNPVTVQATVALAQRFLSACAPERLPVIIFAGTQMRGGHSLDLLDWIPQQPDAIAAIPTVALVDADDEPARQHAAAHSTPTVGKPVEMYELIAAMKTLGLAEKVKIDAMTLTVQVELCPRDEDGGP
jgi:CheY-like chemotaxis protein